MDALLSAVKVACIFWWPPQTLPSCSHHLKFHVNAAFISLNASRLKQYYLDSCIALRFA